MENLNEDEWEEMYLRMIEWLHGLEWKSEWWYLHSSVLLSSFENFGTRYLDIKPVRTLSRLEVEMDRGCLRARLLPLPGSVRDCFATFSG